MQHWDVIFWLGVILIVLGIVFLPFKPPENVKIAVKLFGAEFEINTPAIAITLLGAALAIAASVLPPSMPAPPGPPAPIPAKPPQTPETSGTAKPPVQGPAREEGDEQQLESAGYDADKLKPLAASTVPAVREEANRRLGQIDKDENDLSNAAYDKTKLLQLEHDAQSPKVRDEALDRLKVIEDEVQRLTSADYEKEELTRLAHDAHSREVRAEASDRLKIIEDEEKSLTSAAQDKTLLSALEHDAHSPKVRDEARRRLDLLPNESSEAHNQPQQFETREPKSVSPLMGYATFAVIDKNNKIKKQYLKIEGKSDQQFPAPNDIVIAIIERAIVAVPYHWDITSGTLVRPIQNLAQIKTGHKAMVGGDVFISSDSNDPNGDRYVIAPISNLIGTDYRGANSNFTPIASAKKIIGYVYVGQIDNKASEYKFVERTFLNRTHPDAIFPAVNDAMVATKDVNVHAGPKHWDAAKQDYVKPDPQGDPIETGQEIVVGGDTILTSGGTSIWTPISAINPTAPAPAPTVQAPKLQRDTNLAPVGAASAPSFSCTGSLSPVETLICKDPELAKLDAKQARIYQKAFNALQGKQKQELKSEQLAWINKRNACAGNGAVRKCVEDALGRRLSALRSRYGSGTN